MVNYKEIQVLHLPLLLHAVYAAILYTIGPRQKMLIYFFLLVISAITTVLIDDDKLIYTGFVSGANDYVMKPMNAMELRGRVRSLTDLKQSVNERLRLEAAYLQAQIQPHFLFNTLNSISALASFDTQRMSHLIDVFSSYLRLSFNFLNAE
ncbi:histidine kinase [Paenibacillus sp. Marseille-Q9583]